jgi:toxin ParE1/3/4
VSSYASWSKRMSSPPWNYRNCVRTYAKAWIAARNQTCRSPEDLKEECEIRSQFLVSPRARVNLIEIGATLLMTVWQTHTRLSTNATKCCRLGSQPSGCRREELAPGMRSFPFGRYVIFYHVVTNAIEIVRVLLGGRDTESIFEGHAKHSDPSS